MTNEQFEQRLAEVKTVRDNKVLSEEIAITAGKTWEYTKQKAWNDHEKEMARISGVKKVRNQMKHLKPSKKRRKK